MMENLSALKSRHPVVCPERSLFDVQNGTWFVKTIRASGHMRRANRPDTRPHLTKDQSHQKYLAKQEPSTQDKPDSCRCSTIHGGGGGAASTQNVAVRRNFPKAVIRDRLLGPIPNRSFAAGESDVLHAGQTRPSLSVVGWERQHLHHRPHHTTLFAVQRRKRPFVRPAAKSGFGMTGLRTVPTFVLRPKT